MGREGVSSEVTFEQRLVGHDGARQVGRRGNGLLERTEATVQGALGGKP